VNDLDRGITWIERRGGVRAVVGGVHPGRGTRNALLSLGSRRYLEIMAPDPAQPASSETRGLSHLSSPRLIGWASHLDNAQSIADRLTKAGIAFNGPTAGSRKRPDGRVLNWKTVELKDDASGTLPFFIEWGADSTHPSEDSPAGLRLTALACNDTNQLVWYCHAGRKAPLEVPPSESTAGAQPSARRGPLADAPPGLCGHQRR
jgi:hypothetical protein